MLDRLPDADSYELVLDVAGKQLRVRVSGAAVIGAGGSQARFVYAGMCLMAAEIQTAINTAGLGPETGS